MKRLTTTVAWFRKQRERCSVIIVGLMLPAIIGSAYGVVHHLRVVSARAAVQTEYSIRKLALEVKRIESKHGLPPNQSALGALVGIPIDAWGQPVNYVFLPNNQFKIWASSPYPEWLIFEYYSGDPSGRINHYLF